ncbi:hypothetical protein IIB34_08675, partial [PVC group bacterium]|nr:hypothetical protein [PVC group bacterium]
DVFRTTYDLGSVTLFNRTECVGLEAIMTVFVPMNDKVELWIMDIKNISSKTQKIDAIPCVPIFGGNRAYAEYHRDVVRLYNKTEIDKKESVISIHPGLEWVEGATDPSSINYFMKASLENSKAPDRFYTDRDTFLGAHNQWGEPLSLLTDTPPDRKMLGEEAVGAIEFKNIVLEPGQSAKIYVITGIAFDRHERDNAIKKYTPIVIEKSLEEVHDYWQKMTNKRVIKTKNKDFDFSWNKWWLYQLQLRFWFGNTGHPQFDYGSDFCGWREIWQDMIGTILMDSDKMEEHLIRTLEGIRMDGTNATRFFVRTRKFGSDEVNGLWCDHPYWTTQTILIYAEHVGNPKFLFHDGIRYFRDLYIDRGDTKDECWAKGTVGFLKNKMNTNATGTILEHLLCQLYPMFFDVGKNDLLAVKRADWNDAVDQTRGESVTFSMGFVEDCRDLAKYLEKLLKNHNITETPIAKELRVLIANNRSSIVEKRSRLKTYVDSVNIRSSGEKENVELRELINDLNEKSVLMKNRINEKAWTGEYYIAYFDHEGQAIKGSQNQDLAIYLMPQAFAIFSGVVEGERLTTMIQAVDKYLYDTKVGGYKLNYPAYETFDKDIGRITGFAAGTKENSAIFNHANLFYMNALARLKKAENAFKVWDGINPVRHSQMQSMILPWLPEYWVSSDNPNIAGKGEYPILTGSAVWTRINFERFI